jgi:hypothetical protein
MAEHVAACLATFDGSRKGRQVVLNGLALLLLAAEWVTVIYISFWLW